MTNSHSLKLFSEYFDLIEAGIKVYEGRLNDEKRQEIDEGDQILFLREPDRIKTIKAKVIEKLFFKDFEEMSEKLDKTMLGFENKTREEMVEVYNSIYDRKRIDEYGVVVFKIKLMNGE